MPLNKRNNKFFLAVFLFVLVFVSSYRKSLAQTGGDWYMAGANPQRTSWVTEEVRGGFNVDWYQSIEPYIPYRVQPVFYNNIGYISTSKGLYAFDLAATVGAGGSRVKWIYATELPLGHSPTIATVNGKVVAYVGGFDKKVHAIDTATGQGLAGYVAYEAGAGFETNPLIINDSYTGNASYVVAGNRDGKIYALNAVTGAKVWEFATGGPIQLSAAYKNGVIYFASNDLYVYAVNISNGSQKWKSNQKFQYSSGFYSFWPIIYTEKLTNTDYIILGGAINDLGSGGDTWLNKLDQNYLVPGCMSATGACSGSLWPKSTANGDSYFSNGTTLMDTNGKSAASNTITQYFKTYPNRHFLYILDINTGSEVKFDIDGGGADEYAPFTWSSGQTASGAKYPGVVNGLDKIFYNSTIFSANRWISRSDPVGWKWGTGIVSEVSGSSHAVDEPIVYSGGGKVMYWSLCCDREAGAFDVTMPLSTSNRAWSMYGYNLVSKAPDYRIMYHDGDNLRYLSGDGWNIYSGKNKSKNGVYSNSGSAQTPPIPYKGKVYVLRGNALIAWNPGSGAGAKLAVASNPSNQLTAPSLSPTSLKSRLESEVQMIVNSPVMRPGYYVSGLLNNASSNTSASCNFITIYNLLDYFHNPADTVYTLSLAYPHVSAATQLQIKTFLQSNYWPGKTYDFTRFVHVGWGAPGKREAATIPSESNGSLSPNSPSSVDQCSSVAWSFNPMNFYAAYKYVQLVENSNQAVASTLFNAIKAKIEAPKTTMLADKPYLANAYLAGYHGYLQLKLMAGLGADSTVQGYYNTVLNIRKNFNKDTPYWPDSTLGGQDWSGKSPIWRIMDVAANFTYLTPDTATILKNNIASSTLTTALKEYQDVAPYWFVNRHDATIGEGSMHHLLDNPAIFQAKAWIEGASYSDLAKYIDSPAFEKGDLFYIQNIAAALSASSGSTSPTPTPAPKPGDLDGDKDVDIFDYNKVVNLFGNPYTIFDYNSVIGNFGK